MKKLPVLLEDNLEMLSTITNDAIAIHRDGKFIYTNKKSEDFLEADLENQLIGKKIISIIHPMSLQSVSERIKGLEQGKTQEPAISKLITLKGNIRYAEIAATPVLYQDKPSNLLIAKDVGAIIKKNEELADRQDYLKAIIGSIPDIIFVINKDLKFKEIFVNNEELLQYPKEKFPGASLIDMLPPNIYIEASRNINDVFANGKISITNYSLDSAEGKKYFEIRTNKKNENEVVSIIRNITKETAIIKELEYKDNLQKLITELSTEFLNINIGTFDKIIKSSLAKLGNFLELDDVSYIEYDLDKKLIKPKYKWSISEKGEIEEMYTDLPIEIFSNWITSHFRGAYYLIEDVENSNIGKVSAFYFKKLKINSHLSIPIFKDLECIGFICFEKRYQSRTYSESEIVLLNIFAKLIGNLFSRINHLKLLENKNNELERIRLKNKKLIEELQSEINDRIRIDEELAISKSQLELTIQNSPLISIQWYNREGKILMWNNASHKVFGFSKEEALGKTLKDLFMSEEEHSEYLNLLSEIDKSGLPYGPYEIPIKRKDGSIGWVLSTTFSVPASDNEKIFVCMDTDITVQKLLYEQLNNSLLEKDKFLSIVAHDLKSPFSGFLGMTKILAHEFSDMDANEIKEISSNLFESAENLYMLLENLLEWSRIQRNMVSINKECINLKDLINNNINLQKLKIDQKSINIENTIIEDKFVFADMNMINAILRNLISNALKFTRSNGKIKIYTLEDEIYDIVAVEDNGIGIPNEINKSLFTLTNNVSRKGTDGEPSTGLGLILCKEYTDLHNGQIWVKSIENIGSTFYFSIPKNQNG